MSTQLFKIKDKLEEAKQEVDYILLTKLMKPDTYAMTLGRAQALKVALDLINESLKNQIREDKDVTC